MTSFVYRTFYGLPQRHATPYAETSQKFVNFTEILLKFDEGLEAS
jgi:hypothetical protein